MEQKRAVYKGLQYTEVLYTDTTAASVDYLRITNLPTRLTAGKNAFKLRGNPENLVVGSYIDIEVLDYNGNPIYSEVIDYIDEDASRVIAIYIYSDTPPGDCTITVLAEAKLINGAVVPIEWQNRANIKWISKLPVNPNTVNTTQILFETLPEVTIDEFVGVQLDRVYSISQFPTYNTGQIKYFEYNNEPIIEISGGSFTSDMQNGVVTVNTPNNPFPTPNYAGYTTQFTSNIKKILTPTTAVLDSKYTVYTSQSIFPHTYSAFDYSAFSIDYEETPTYIETQNSQSYAFIQINKLQPATGDVSRIKVFSNSNGTVGTWELVSDTQLTATEIFIANTASLYPDRSIGIFTSQSIIDAYWDAATYQGNISSTSPVLTWTTSSLDNAMQISGSVNLDIPNTIYVVKTKPAVSGVFNKNSTYQIRFDAVATSTTSTTPEISVYLSGSAFYADPTDISNQQYPEKLGKRVGHITIPGSTQRIDNQLFEFTADYDGSGSLIFVIESGIWQLSNIHVTSIEDAGFTPNYTRIRCYVPTIHKSDNQLTFKIEYYNIAGEQCKQASYVYNKDWQGGNRYIDGDYSLLTGSLYVADSLQSGIAISGYANSGYIRSLGFEGFAADQPGFLIWSGSALSGSAGTKGGGAYSGVGLELYANTSSYFRYSTADSEIDVRTDKFFFGNPAGTYISGSNGLLQISSSGFHLNTDGSVTASSFIAISGSNVLFDSNSEFVDGINVGRVVYFDRNEYSYTGDLTANPQTASIFETYILPGETRMQVSYMYQFSPAVPADAGTIRARWYIQSASATSSVGPGTSTGYNEWSIPESISSGFIQVTPIAGIATEGGAQTKNINTNSTPFINYQGHFVRVYMIIDRTQSGSISDNIKFNNFVYRTSRIVGSTIQPLPSGPVI